MEREIARLLPYFLIGMFVLGLLLFLLALHQLRLRRTGAYWRMRRRAGDRGGRLFLLSIGLMASSIVLAVLSGLGALAYRNISGSGNRGPEDLYGIILSPTVTLDSTAEASAQAATSTLPATPIPVTSLPATSAAPTATVQAATGTPSAAPTAIPLPTDTPSATPTPTPDFAVLLHLTPIFNSTPRPASADALLRIDGAGDSAAAMAGNAEFRAGLQRIYLFIAFDHLDNGVAWSRVLYRDGVPVQGNTLLWSLGASGSSVFFFGDEAGYPPGEYEVRLYLGDREASRFLVTLVAG